MQGRLGWLARQVVDEQNGLLVRGKFAQDERFAVAASVGEFPDDDLSGVDEVLEVFVAHGAADELGLARELVARDALRAAGGDDLEDALLGLFVRVLRERFLNGLDDRRDEEADELRRVLGLLPADPGPQRILAHAGDGEDERHPAASRSCRPSGRAACRPSGRSPSSRAPGGRA